MLHDATGQDRTGQNRKGKEEREGGDDDIDQAVAMYNIAAERSGLPLVQKLSDTRKKHLRARLKDAGGIEGWAAALNKLEQSAFCRGDNDRGWKADFDFIVRESSFIKLMEGKYDGKPSTNADRNREALHQWANEPMDG